MKHAIMMIATAMMLTSPAHARNYLKSNAIAGDHEDEIDIQDIVWKMRPSKSGDKGIIAIMIAPNPALASRAASRRPIRSLTIVIEEEDRVAEYQFLNAIVTGYESTSSGTEAEISAEKINILYTMQADDHSSRP